MTPEEAEMVGLIAGRADAGCSTCVDKQIAALNAAFPMFVWEVTDRRQMAQPDWSDDPNDAFDIGLVVEVRPA